MSESSALQSTMLRDLTLSPLPDPGASRTSYAPSENIHGLADKVVHPCCAE
ncbi:MAG: hypothetical protein QGH58_06795 [Arenicellales bacterium]|nr:hypothetical protein [Arenicellales bacterium]